MQGMDRVGVRDKEIGLRNRKREILRTRLTVMEKDRKLKRVFYFNSWGDSYWGLQRPLKSQSLQRRTAKYNVYTISNDCEHNILS